MFLFRMKPTSTAVCPADGVNRQQATRKKKTAIFRDESRSDGPPARRPLRTVGILECEGGRIENERLKESIHESGVSAKGNNQSMNALITHSLPDPPLGRGISTRGNWKDVQIVPSALKPLVTRLSIESSVGEWPWKRRADDTRPKKKVMKRRRCDAKSRSPRLCGRSPACGPFLYFSVSSFCFEPWDWRRFHSKSSSVCIRLKSR